MGGGGRQHGGEGSGGPVPVAERALHAQLDRCTDAVFQRDLQRRGAFADEEDVARCVQGQPHAELHRRIGADESEVLEEQSPLFGRSFVDANDDARQGKGELAVVAAVVVTGEGLRVQRQRDPLPVLRGRVAGHVLLAGTVGDAHEAAVAAVLADAEDEGGRRG